MKLKRQHLQTCVKLLLYNIPPSKPPLLKGEGINSFAPTKQM